MNPRFYDLLCSIDRHFSGLFQRVMHIAFCSRKALTAFLSLLLFTSSLISCISIEKPDSILYVRENGLPFRVAVLPTLFLSEENDKKEKPKSEKEIFMAELARGVIYNHVAGKGYQPLKPEVIDTKLRDLERDKKDWTTLSSTELCEALDADGLVYIHILSTTMIKAFVYNHYQFESEVKMINDKGEVVGQWKESSSKRKLSVPTSIPGTFVTIAEAVLDEPAKKHMRLVIQDWGWKMTPFIPECPYGKSLPEILSIETNIDKEQFKQGDKITVKVHAEKSLICTFDLGDFKKNIPMSQNTEGVYQGIYVVREGDKAKHQPLSIHLLKSNGIERVWMETGGAVTIDAVPPPQPSSFRFESSKKGISLFWEILSGDDVEAFVIEKSEHPVGDFSTLLKMKDFHFLDMNVKQGATYFYKISSIDKMGNHSSPSEILKATMPVYDEVQLNSVLKGILPPGAYRIEKNALIPKGDILKISPGSRINFSIEGKMKVEGTLHIKGNPGNPTVLSGENWQGLEVAPGGKVGISHTQITGCLSCLQIKGGSLEMNSVEIKGNHGDGVVVGKNALFTLENVHIVDSKRGFVLDDGRGVMKDSTLTRNSIGMEYIKGNIKSILNNIYDNQTDIKAHEKLTVQKNFLGTVSVEDLKIEGEVMVRSLLDAPYPHGKEMKVKSVTPQQREKQFQKYKTKGITAFKQKNYGDSYQYLSKAMALKADREGFLYLAYILMQLGEKKNLEETLKKGIEAFPYEVRLYQCYIRLLLAQGKKKESFHLIERALKLNPEDVNLQFMKEYIGEMLEEKSPDPDTEKKRRGKTVKKDREAMEIKKIRL